MIICVGQLYVSLSLSLQLVLLLLLMFLLSTVFFISLLTTSRLLISDCPLRQRNVAGNEMKGHRIGAGSAVSPVWRLCEPTTRSGTACRPLSLSLICSPLHRL